MYRQAQRENYTIRQLYQAVALGRGHRVVVGTAADIVDQMESWHAAQATDGYNIIPSHLPSGIDDFVDLVVPELQRRGLFRREYQGKTLRENLGLATEKRWSPD
jgi:alkanesulfonate monooxygenase